MTVSFVRIDDRMIHGQTVTRWAKEYPCDGLIAVNDAAASNKVLTQAYKGASDKKTFVWTVDAFGKKSDRRLHHKRREGQIIKRRSETRRQKSPPRPQQNTGQGTQNVGKSKRSLPTH